MPASAIPVPARVFAAADNFHNLTQDRPHPAADAHAQAAESLAAEARAGRLGTDCVLDLVEGAGQAPDRHQPAERAQRPAGGGAAGSGAEAVEQADREGDG